MLLKEVFDGFNVPLGSEISIHLGNLSKENASPSRKALSMDSRDEGVHAKRKHWWNQTHTKLLHTITMTGTRKCSLGVLTHSPSIGQKLPKAMELLTCYFHCRVAKSVQHGETT